MFKSREFFVIVLTLACITHARDVCYTLSGQQGSCMPLKECLALQQHLGASSRVTTTNRRFKPCPYSAIVPKICCVPLFSSVLTYEGRDDPLVNSSEPVASNTSTIQPPKPPIINSDEAADPLTPNTQPSNLESPLKPPAPIIIPPGVSVLFPKPVRLSNPKLSLLPMSSCGVSTVDLIWKGKQATRGQFPWLALLCYNSLGGDKLCLCGGSIINSRYVLTAAHCVLDSQYLNITSVKLGEHDTRTDPDCDAPAQCSPPVQEVTIEKVIKHPKYGKPHNLNDIALLRLAREINIDTDYVRAICLPVDNIQFKNPEYIAKMIVAGWGRTEFDAEQGSKVLRFVGLPPMSYARCNIVNSGRRVIQPSQICCGGDTEDSCSGDSGGPLFMPDVIPGSHTTRAVQVGLVSFGPRMCGTPGRPGVYTRVGYFIDWILDNMEP